MIRFFLILTAAVFLLGRSEAVLAARQEDSVLREEKGLKFKIPSDWPIEERNNVVAPIPIEEYLSRKFGGVNSRLDSLETRIAELERRLTAAEQEVDLTKGAVKSINTRLQEEPKP